MDSWDRLFERAARYDVTVADVERALTERRRSDHEDGSP
jgi:hypothetical protein